MCIKWHKKISFWDKNGKIEFLSKGGKYLRLEVDFFFGLELFVRPLLKRKPVLVILPKKYTGRDPFSNIRVRIHSRFFYKQFFYKHWGSNSQKIKQFLSICWGWSWSKNKHWVKQSEARQNLSIGKHFEPGERSIDGPNFSFLYAPNRY